MFIDSHCHVDVKDFDEDRDAVLARAKEAGVGELIVVAAGRTLEELQRTVDFASGHSHIHATVGIHPHEAQHVSAAMWPEVCALASRDDVVAIGETGLDYYYDSSPREEQVAWFLEHIELAARLGKPLICHIRDAHPEATAILREHAAGRVRTIIHCFTGTPEEAATYADMGFYISFSGIVTFKGKAARPVREAVKVVPHDQLLIETDCPYLAPVPLRGKRNEPSFLVHTADVVAQAAGVSVSELAAITVSNTRDVFGLTSP